MGPVFPPLPPTPHPPLGPETMSTHRVHPNVRCFSSVIKAHATAGDVDAMERRFRQLMAPSAAAERGE